MDNTKIIFFDIDGTLIDMEKKCVTEKMLETLRRLQEKGIIICIATGRSPMDVPKFQGVEFDAIINFNGSYCHCGNKQIYSNPLRTNDIKTIIRNASDDLKAISEQICGHVAEDGIYYFSKENNLI